MALRFFRRLKILPGVTLNLSKRGGSLSFGGRGARLTAGTSGTRRTLSLPGTGLWYTEQGGGGKRDRRDAGGSRRGAGSGRTGGDKGDPPTPTVPPEDRLDLGFFRRLFTPQGEEDFVDGMRHVVTGDEETAYRHLCEATHVADAAFMAGMLALKFERFEEAARHLGYARQRQGGLGKHFARYGIDAAVSLPITDRIVAHVGPAMRGIRLGLVEAHQGRGRWQDAIRELEKLHERHPEDPVVLLSLAELLVEEAGSERACERVVKLTTDVDNESEVHAAILLWKGKALARLGLDTAARDALTAAFRRKKDRDAALLRAIRYERALAYERLGRGSRAREELEKLYAEAPDYEDVAERLELSAA